MRPLPVIVGAAGPHNVYNVEMTFDGKVFERLRLTEDCLAELGWWWVTEGNDCEMRLAFLNLYCDDLFDVIFRNKEIASLWKGLTKLWKNVP